jgi:hypothetical protein
MTEILITPMEPGRYGVQVTEGDTTTSHRVEVPRSMLEDQLLTEADPELVVRESFEFLLERERATSILPEFSLADIAGYFPDYYGELRRRLGTG